MTDETEKDSSPFYNLATDSSSRQCTQTRSHPSPDNPSATGMSGLSQAGQPVLIYNYGHSQPTVYKSYHNYHSMGLGITQIILGVLCIAFNIAAIAVGARFSVASIGIWGGLMFIICGSFGISASKLHTKCMIVTFLVLCIISVVITIPLFIVSVIGAVDIEYNQCWWYPDHDNNDYWEYYCRPTRDAALAMNCMLAVLAVVVAATCICGSVICCKATCCCNTNKNMQQQQQQQTASLPTQCVTMQGGQPMLIVPQPRLNYGGQVVYVQGYPAAQHQQILTVPAPPYQINYPMNTSPMMVQSNNNIRF